MPRKPNPPRDDPEQSQRFIEIVPKSKPMAPKRSLIAQLSGSFGNPPIGATPGDLVRDHLAVKNKPFMQHVIEVVP